MWTKSLGCRSEAVATRVVVLFVDSSFPQDFASLVAVRKERLSPNSTSDSNLLSRFCSESVKVSTILFLIVSYLLFFFVGFKTILLPYCRIVLSIPLMFILYFVLRTSHCTRGAISNCAPIWANHSAGSALQNAGTFIAMLNNCALCPSAAFCEC